MDTAALADAYVDVELHRAGARTGPSSRGSRWRGVEQAAQLLEEVRTQLATSSVAEFRERWATQLPG